MDNYNQLTPAQTEQLAGLAEEMGEALQIIGKILRHGYEESSPFDPFHRTNRVLLEKELGDVAFWVRKMEVEGQVDLHNIQAGTLAKSVSVQPYLHHNDPVI